MRDRQPVIIRWQSTANVNKNHRFSPKVCSFFPLGFALHLNNSTIQLTLMVWIHSYNDTHIKALKMSINFMVWLWSTVSLLASV